MATNKVQEGKVISWTNGTGSDVTSGSTILLSGGKAGVALVDIANGATGAVAVEEVYSIAKKTGAGETFSQGQGVYLSATAGTATQSTTGTTLVGYAFDAALSAAATVNVKLNG